VSKRGGHSAEQKYMHLLIYILLTFWWFCNEFSMRYYANDPAISFHKICRPMCLPVLGLFHISVVA
jgi:hypothetical protein